MRRILVAVLACFMPVLASAQGQQKDTEPPKPKESRLFFEASGGSYTLPGILLEKGDVKKHPDRLAGTIASLGARVRLGKGWSLGAEAFRIRSHGQGPWSRNDTATVLASEHVDGSVTGRTDVVVTGGQAYADKEFSSWRVRPYVRFGGGGGMLRAYFQGRFIGIPIVPPGTPASYRPPPIDVPASDHYKTAIPVFTGEGGARFRTKHVAASASYYWNTGHGFKGTLTLSF